MWITKVRIFVNFQVVQTTRLLPRQQIFSGLRKGTDFILLWYILTKRPYHALYGGSNVFSKNATHLQGRWEPSAGPSSSSSSLPPPPPDRPPPPPPPPLHVGSVADPWCHTTSFFTPGPPWPDALTADTRDYGFVLPLQDDICPLFGSLLCNQKIRKTITGRLPKLCFALWTFNFG